jgi:tetratricopeptide (TPR) repeat protein
VFAGGWTVEASEVVCGDPPLRSDEILDLLTGLVNRSLVGVHEQDGRSRFRFLETVRVYASERLQESGEVDVVRAHHRDWWLAFAEGAAVELGRHDQVAWFRRLVDEHDNIRAALETCRAETNGAEAELRLAAAMGQFWRMQHPGEGRRRLAEALARADRKRALHARRHSSGKGISKSCSGTYPRVGLCYRTHCVTHGPWATARAAHALRQLAMATSDADAARRIALLDEALALARSVGADGEAAGLLANLAAAAAEAGDPDRVRVLLEEGDLLGRRSADAWFWVQPLAQLGWLAIEEGRLADADIHFRMALDLAEGIGYVAPAAFSLVGLGQLTLRRSDLEQASALHCEALHMQRDAGGAYLASGLVYLASVEAAAGRHDIAQRLMGASEAWHAARGGAFEVWLPWTHGPLRRGLVSPPPTPTDPELAHARAEGRLMLLDEAVTWALHRKDAALTRASG